MEDFKNDFTWSVSRHSTFEECRRKYYYQYYGSWGGWSEWEAAPETRELYVLKQLVSRWMWKGGCVHDEIERALRQYKTSGTLPTPEESVLRLGNVMREGWRQSRAKHYRSAKGGLKHETALFEHEYDSPVSAEEWKKNFDDSLRCIRAFYDSKALARLRDVPRDEIIHIEQLVHFPLGGVKVWVKLDLAFIDAGKFNIVDWKTGQKEADDFQFKVYSLFVSSEFGLPVEKIELTECNLHTADQRVHVFTPREIEEAAATIASSMAAMRGMLADPEHNEASMGDFPRTSDEWKCNACKYKGICFELD